MAKRTFSLRKKHVIQISLAVGAMLVVAGLVTSILSFSSIPKLDTIKDYNPPRVSHVFDRAGHLIGEFYTEKRTVIDSDDLPQYVKNAFIAAEDADFYHHKGIDYVGVLRAVATEVKYKLIGGRRVGGSTITQQTARAMLLNNQRTYTRKLKEFWIAKKIEENLSKKEILNLYLNQIYFGHGAYGIEEAAQTYFGIHAKDLSLAQAAALASAPKSPNRINPITDPQRVKARREYVLDQMLSNNMITPSQAMHAKKDPIIVHTERKKYMGIAPYFVDAIRQKLVEELGEETVNTSGLSVYTSLDANMQVAANEALKKGLRELDKRQGFRSPLIRLDSSSSKTAAQSLEKLKKSLFDRYKQDTVVWDLGSVTQDALLKGGDTLLEQVHIRNKQTANIMAARIIQVSDTSQMVTVDMGTSKATMPFSTMQWARPFNPESYTPIPKKPSDVLKVGDIVWVKIDSLSPLMVSLEQMPKVEGAFVAISPHTRQVLAMVGGYDFGLSNYNRALLARRQAGSAFKAFIYATAIEKQAVTPATIITDAPKVYFNGDNEDEWRPKNSTKKYLGDITVRTCLFRSVNTCSISLLEKVGISSVLELAKNAHMSSDKSPFPRNLTLALGTGEVTPLDFTNAFAIFPSLGQYATPVMIERVLDTNGQLIFESHSESIQVLSPQAAFIMTNLMRSVIDRTGARLTAGLRRPLAGKTGTTNDYRSVWFMGYSPDIVAGVFIGFDNNRSIGISEYAIRNTMPVWVDFMRKVLPLLPESQFEQPEGITWRLIDEKTGLLANGSAETGTQALEDENPDAPPKEETGPDKVIWEAFITGTEPTQSVSNAPMKREELGASDAL